MTVRAFHRHVNTAYYFHQRVNAFRQCPDWKSVWPLAGLLEKFSSSFHEHLRDHEPVLGEESVKFWGRPYPKWPNNDHFWTYVIINWRKNIREKSGLDHLCLWRIARVTPQLRIPARPHRIAALADENTVLRWRFGLPGCFLVNSYFQQFSAAATRLFHALRYAASLWCAAVCFLRI